MLISFFLMIIISTSLTVPTQPSPRFLVEAWFPLRNCEKNYCCLLTLPKFACIQHPCNKHVNSTSCTHTCLPHAYSIICIHACESILHECRCCINAACINVGSACMLHSVVRFACNIHAANKIAWMIKFDNLILCIELFIPLYSSSSITNKF